ncbi:MAG: glycosyltransferase [Caldilineaceae bacterium]
MALLDHDDLWAINTLYEVTHCLNGRGATANQTADAGAVDIIYFDEDKISADGLRRSAPWFKPQWSPDVLLGTNVLMHCVIRRTLLQQIGGFDANMDGAQDWDVALRCAEITNRMVHIPKVLYHWRQIEGSAALSADAKPWAYAAQLRCIEAHLERLGIPGAKAISPSLGVVRVLWPTTNAKISIIIPTKDKHKLLRACLDSIFNKSSYQNYEIILVDTGSSEAATQSYYATLQNNERVHTISYTGAFNYSKANNLGAQHATGDLLLFLNNDTEVLEPTWLEDMAGWAMRPQIGVVGAKLIRPDDTIQHAGIVMGLIGHGSHVFDGGHENVYGIFGSPEYYRNYLAVTGACMMIQRTKYDKLGGFDEVYEIGFSDMELCLRAVERGYRNAYTPFARLLHHEGGSRGYYLPPSDVLRATYQMWPVIERGDPHFNPNLSHLKRVPTIGPPDEKAADLRLLEVLQNYGLIRFTAPTHLMNGNALAGVEPDLPTPIPWPACAKLRVENEQAALHILLVSHDLSLSGAPILMLTLARYLKKLGHRLTLASPYEGPLRQEYEALGVDVLVADELLDDVRIDAHIVCGEYQLVVANTILGWRSILAAKAFHIPSILWIHESKFGQETVRHKVGVKDALNAASVIIFPTQTTANLYQEFLTRNNGHVFPYGLDVDELARSIGNEPLRHQMATDKVRVVNIGSVEPRKGQDVLLKAVESMPSTASQSMELYMLGRLLDKLDANFTQRMRSEVDRVPNAHLLDQLPRAAIMAHLQAADIFVLPSRDEVLPVTILEAMYHGKAIISTCVGGVAEIIEDGVNGLLVDVEDHKALAASLAQLCGDAELRKRLGKAARKTFHERLTMQQFGPAFEEMMKQALNMTVPGQ